MAFLSWFGESSLDGSTGFVEVVTSSVKSDSKPPLLCRFGVVYTNSISRVTSTFLGSR